ncbi:hypothetical protein TIFTF001_039006 [Ficus carica]|uniref:Uncharacterized protein n=1 Tax=Ficus carica TaxID=3494 RepID=A0AA88EDB3_FICCA|nr:hypothetical protein TIFTF001_039006 [Ficus carica]
MELTQAWAPRNRQVARNSWRCAGARMCVGLALVRAHRRTWSYWDAPHQIQHVSRFADASAKTCLLGRTLCIRDPGLLMRQSDCQECAWHA